MKNKNTLSILDRANISHEEVLYIIEQLALMISSGVNLRGALESIKLSIKNSTSKKVITILKEEVDSGNSLSSALASVKIFPPYVISLMRIGEESGSLPKTLRIVSDEQRKNFELRSKIRGAMLYPVGVLFAAAVIGIGIAWFILPRLATVFSSLHLKLPAITKVLIAVGSFLGTYGAYFVPAVILAIGLFVYFVFIFHGTKFIGEYLLLRMPGIRDVIRESETARFGYMSGMLLSSGVPIGEVYSSLEQASNMHVYKKLYHHMAVQIRDGNSVAKSMASFKNSAYYISLPLQQLIATGGESGTLPEVFLKIADIYNEKTEVSTKNLAVILEPVMLVIVWIAVVAIALAIILPIYSLIGGLTAPS